MAMGLGTLGRGKVWHTIYLSILHILGATLGGALTGITLACLGTLLSLSEWRPGVIAIVAVFALWQSLSHRPSKLGLHRQVPRKWARTMTPSACYFLWGILLGSGVTILIPYSAYLIVLGTQLTSGVVLSCISGAIFGSTREIVALSPLFYKQNRLQPETMPSLFFKIMTIVSRLNLLYILVGSLLLIITSVY